VVVVLPADCPYALGYGTTRTQYEYGVPPQRKLPGYGVHLHACIAWKFSLSEVHCNAPSRHAI
jgi:hypothetical protein